jgi:hypothetical protein
VALQGTLDTFALADLVRLLATTSKTGELAIDGDRGSGRLWFADGQLVGGEPTADDLADVVFALLRMQEGDFAFEADTGPEDPREPCSALDVLAAAEARLEEWRPVEELVPSPAVALTLRADLPSDEVTIDRDLWRRLVAVGSGTTAGAFAAALELDEHAAAFAVRDLVDAGLVEVGPEVEEPVLAVAEPVEPVVGEPIVAEPVAAEPVADVAPEAFAPVEVAPVPADVAEVTDTAHGADETLVEAALATDAEDVPPVMGVVPDPPYSFGAWGEGPVPAPEDQVDTAALGPWEPLTPTADLDPVVEPAVAPAPEPALQPVDDLPSLDAPVPPDLGSYAVDLDSQLGGGSAGHSYLGTADVGTALPEPLLGADGIVDSDAAVLSAPPEPPAPATEPEPGTGAADELAARRERAVDERWSGADASDDLGVPLDSLSPAAARALAAAASADDDGTQDEDAGRRVLRRIISTGKG